MIDGTIGPNGWINLGWANSWKELPAILVTCQEKAHLVDVQEDYDAHITWVKCFKCMYIYKSDSS